MQHLITFLNQFQNYLRKPKVTSLLAKCESSDSQLIQRMMQSLSGLAFIYFLATSPIIYHTSQATS